MEEKDELWAWEFTKVTPLPDEVEEPFFIEKTTQVQHVLIRDSLKIPLDQFRPHRATGNASKTMKQLKASA